MQTLVLKDINAITCGEICTFVYIIVSKQQQHFYRQPEATEDSFSFVCGSFCLCHTWITQGESKATKPSLGGCAVNSAHRAVPVRMFLGSGVAFVLFGLTLALSHVEC